MDEKQEKDALDKIEMTDDNNLAGEDTEIADLEDQSNNKIKQLRDKLKECESQKMEYLEDLQRARAEFLNGKRRLDEDRVRDKERAENKLVDKLLPMADSFHMAMHDKELWNSIDETWRKGVESIHNQLHNILDSYGVIEINPAGDEFNPHLHEAVTNVPVEKKEMDGKVISVIQNGFLRKTGDDEELLRPARVTIGEYTQKN